MGLWTARGRPEAQRDKLRACATPGDSVLPAGEALAENSGSSSIKFMLTPNCEPDRFLRGGRAAGGVSGHGHPRLGCFDADARCFWRTEIIRPAHCNLGRQPVEPICVQAHCGPN